MVARLSAQFDPSQTTQIVSFSVCVARASTLVAPVSSLVVAPLRFDPRKTKRLEDLHGRDSNISYLKSRPYEFCRYSLFSCCLLRANFYSYLTNPHSSSTFQQQDQERWEDGDELVPASRWSLVHDSSCCLMLSTIAFTLSARVLALLLPRCTLPLLRPERNSMASFLVVYYVSDPVCKFRAHVLVHVTRNLGLRKVFLMGTQPAELCMVQHVLPYHCHHKQRSEPQRGLCHVCSLRRPSRAAPQASGPHVPNE